MTVRKSRRGVVAGLAAVTMTVAACGGSGTSSKSSASSSGNSSADTVLIGSVHPLTGSLAGEGKLMDDAVHMAAHDINANGGIKSLGGAKLKVTSADSQGEAAVGQRKAQKLIQSGAAALIGTYQSDVTLNVAAVAERSQVPLVVDVASTDQLIQQGYKYTFRLQPGSGELGKEGADYLAAVAKNSGTPVHTVSYIHIDGAFGQGVSSAFKKEAAKKGIKVVKEVSYDPAHFSDATTQVTQAASVHPDAIVVTGYYPDSLLIEKAIAAVKPDVKAVYGVADGGYNTARFTEDAGSSANGYLSTNYHFAAKKDRVQQIRKRFEQKYRQPMRTNAVLAYESTVVVAHGLERSGSTDPTKLRDAISKEKISDPLIAQDGPIVFNSVGQNKNAQAVLMQVKAGEIKQVYPEQIATAQVKFPATPAQ
jgi:branched-chain amino acid transport system substrate-binding protein